MTLDQKKRLYYIYIYIYKSRDLMRKCLRFCHVALCMSTFLFSLSPPIFLSMISLSYKCRKIKRFGSSFFSNFLNSFTFNFINLKNERFSPFNVSFYVLYIFQFHKISKGQKKSRTGDIERQRVRKLV